MNLLSLISGEQFIIVKAEGGVHIVFEVFKSLSILALLKSKNLQRIINCCMFNFIPHVNVDIFKSAVV